MNASFIENVHVILKIGHVFGVSRYRKKADFTNVDIFVILRDN